MSRFLHHLSLAAPLFGLVFVGYALLRWARLPRALSAALSRFVFVIALPALLFQLLSELSRLPPVDARLLLAFFGGCLLVFGIGRLIAWKCFGLDGVAQSVFALGGVFSNNVLLGLPLAQVSLGDKALPAVAMVVVFNALTLWTLLTVSVEWARHGHFSVHGLARTARGVLGNPLIIGILAGTAYGLAGWPKPPLLALPLALLAKSAAPLALIALGMGLAEYDVRSGWRLSLSITAIKLVLQPLVVWLLARALGLPQLETQVVVLLASIAVGANVYLMSRQCQVLEGPIAASLVLSTALAALSTPLVLSLLGVAA